jgi:cytochrome c oxidase assembly protein subunit 11
MSDHRLARRKRLTALVAITVAAGMVGFAFAMVPLYRLVCQAIGIAGTTRVATAAPAAASNVDVTVRFDSNVDRDLPWEFTPNQKQVTIKFGQSKTVTYHARNLTNETITGQATYNVTPEKIGEYFDKIQCFCFNQQTLGPKQETDMAVTFFVDPALLKDYTTDEVRTITLSYTFFRSLNPQPRSASSVSLVPAAAASEK